MYDKDWSRPRKNENHSQNNRNEDKEIGSRKAGFSNTEIIKILMILFIRNGKQNENRMVCDENLKQEMWISLHPL